MALSDEAAGPAVKRNAYGNKGLSDKRGSLIFLVHLLQPTHNLVSARARPVEDNQKLWDKP